MGIITVNIWVLYTDVYHWATGNYGPCFVVGMYWHWVSGSTTYHDTFGGVFIDMPLYAWNGNHYSVYLGSLS